MKGSPDQNKNIQLLDIQLINLLDSFYNTFIQNMKRSKGRKESRQK